MTTAISPKLDDLPLWRLLVALDDAERTLGSDAPTTRVLARAVQKKLRSRPCNGKAPARKGGACDE
jgi:hypothetical protein